MIRLKITFARQSLQSMILLYMVIEFTKPNDCKKFAKKFFFQIQLHQYARVIEITLDKIFKWMVNSRYAMRFQLHKMYWKGQTTWILSLDITYCFYVIHGSQVNFASPARFNCHFLINQSASKKRTTYFICCWNTKFAF